MAVFADREEVLGGFEEEFKFLFVDTGENYVVGVFEIVELVDCNFFSYFFSYVRFVICYLITIQNNLTQILNNKLHTKLHQFPHHQIIRRHDNQMYIPHLQLRQHLPLCLPINVFHQPLENMYLALDRYVQIL